MLTFITGFQYLFCAVNFYAERPFKESLWRNFYFLGLFLIFMGFHVLVCLIDEENIQELFNVTFFQIKFNIIFFFNKILTYDMEFKVEIVLLGIMYCVLSYALEKSFGICVKRNRIFKK